MNLYFWVKGRSICSGLQGPNSQIFTNFFASFSIHTKNVLFAQLEKEKISFSSYLHRAKTSLIVCFVVMSQIYFTWQNGLDYLVFANSTFLMGLKWTKLATSILTSRLFANMSLVKKSPDPQKSSQGLKTFLSPVLLHCKTQTTNCCTFRRHCSQVNTI